jgi:hypothetical protein
MDGKYFAAWWKEVADSHWPSTIGEHAQGNSFVLNRPPLPASELNMENGMLTQALISQSSMELTTCPSKSGGINSDVSTSVGWLSSVRHFKQAEYVAVKVVCACHDATI